MSIQRRLPFRLSAFAFTALLSLLPFARSHAASETPHQEPLPSIDPASDAVGATPGEFNVDSSGAANYTIPIFTVPAPGGVAPQLALTYSSRGGHGPLGVGWGISGTSSIERCRKTKEHGDGDGPHPPVNFSATDVFCLDGQRLIQIATPTTNPAANCPSIGLTVLAEFRTEIESFSRICAYQGDGISNGPSRFLVERRDGSKAQYGFTADSRVEPNSIAGASAVVMRWTLNRTTQPTGAYIKYEYEESAANDEHRLKRVLYTGNDATNPVTSPGFKVEFTYGAMPTQGQRRDYVAGSVMALTQRLTKVESYGSATQVVRSLELCYDDAASCFGNPNADQATASQRLPRILAIQECANSDSGVTNPTTCRLPTRFEWNMGSVLLSGASESQAVFAPAGERDFRSKQGDFNGDGRADLVGYNTFCSTQNIGANRSPDVVQFVQSVTVDDGSVYISAPTSNNSFATNRIDLGSIAPIKSRAFVRFDPINPLCNSELPPEGRFHVYDFNGDGLDDLLIDVQDMGFRIFTASVSNGVLSFASSGAGTGDAAVPTSESSILSDMDGDGLPDLVFQTVDAQGTRKLAMRKLTRTGGVARFAMTATPVRLLPATGSTELTGSAWLTLPSRKPLSVGDINADGMVDLLVMVNFDPTSTSNPNAKTVLFRTEGLQGTAPSQTLDMRTELEQVGINTAERLQMQDLNGDGLADLVWQSADGDNMSLVYWWNTGASGAARFSGPVSLAISGESIGSTLQDVNADGQIDLVYTEPCGDACGKKRLVTKLASASGAFSSALLRTEIAKAQYTAIGCPTTNSLCKLDSSYYLDTHASGEGEFVHTSTSRLFQGEHYPESIRYRSTGRSFDTDTIKRITNGLDAQVRIEYAPLTHSSVYKRHTGAASLNLGKLSPVFDTFSPMAVVKSVKRSMPTHDDADNMHEMRYQYRGARVQAGGRGFLGFERRSEIDAQSKIATTVQYRQDFPYIGQSKRSLVELLTDLPSDDCSTGPDGAGCLAYSVGADASTLAALSLSGTGKKLRTSEDTHSEKAGSGIKFPYTTSSTETAYALDGVTVLSQTNDAWTYSDDTADNTQGNLEVTACVTGSCGNRSIHTRTWKRCAGGASCDDVIETTTHSYAGIADVAGEGNFTDAGSSPRWQLGLIGSTMVNRARGSTASSYPASDSVTRTEHFGYNDRGLLNHTITEPEDTTTYLFLRTKFARDAWGNVTETVRCSSHFVEVIAVGTTPASSECSDKTGFVQRQWPDAPEKFMRYSTTTYSGDGRFVVSESVPYFDGIDGSAGSLHASFVVSASDRDLLGLPRKRTEASGVVSNSVFGVFGQEQFQSTNTGGFQYTKVRSCTTVTCPSGAAYRVDRNSKLGGDSSSANDAIAPTAFIYFDKLGREVMRTTRLVNSAANKQWSSVRTDYDDRGRIKRVSVPYFSDASGVVQTSNGSCNDLETECWEVKEYDEIDRMKSITKPDLAGTTKTQITYDTTARQTTQSTPQSPDVTITHKTFANSLGETTKVTESNGTDSTLKYAAFGELSQIVKTATLAGQTSTSTVQLSAQFDVRGRKISSTDPDKGTTTHRYNALGELIYSEDAKATRQTRYYDALGRMYYKANHFLVDEGVYSDENEYYSYDFVPAETNGAVGGSGSPPELVLNGQFASSAADWSAKPWAWVSNGGDGNSAAAKINSDETMSQSVAIDPSLQYEASFWFDLHAPGGVDEGVVAELAVHHINNKGVVVQTDVVGPLYKGVQLFAGPSASATVTPHPSAEWFELTFSVSGQEGLSMTVDNVSLRAAPPYTKDPMSAWTPTNVFRYGQLVSSEDNAVLYRRNFAYDEYGRPIGESWNSPAVGYWTVAATEYDQYGRVSKRFDPDRRAYSATATQHRLLDGVQYGYGANGHLVSEDDFKVTETVAQNGAITTSTNFSRLRTLGSQTARGQAEIESFASGGGLSVTRGFDERTGLQTSQLATVSGTTVQSLEYTYDKLGNVSERFNNLGGKREAFGYDGLNRLTKVRQTDDVTNPVATGLVDTLTLGYDDFGNIASKQFGTSSAASQSYKYCDATGCARPHAVKSALGPEPSPALPSDAKLGMTAAYDAVGQVSSTQLHALGTRQASPVPIDVIKRTSRNLYYTWSGRLAMAQSFDSRRDRSVAAGGAFEPDPDGVAALQLFNYGPGGEIVFRSTSLRRLDGAANYVLPQAKQGNGNGNGRNGQRENPGRHLALAFGHDPDYLAALQAMAASDIQRPLKYPALRRLPKDRNQPRSLAKNSCETGTAPPAVPLNDGIAYIFGNTEFLQNNDACNNARRRNLGYAIIEQRQNRSIYDYTPFDWSNGPSSPATTVIYTYQLTDPLGSVDVQVRMTGNTTMATSTAQADRNPRRLSFDAHGQQRNGGLDLNGNGNYGDSGDIVPWSSISAADLRLTRTEGTWQGYAGHETYNSVGIVHMKGRIYDPLLGRFLQPDPIVEDDLNPQTWNRYTYVRNNPMTFNDPTGYATKTEQRVRDGCGQRCQDHENRRRRDWIGTGGSVSGNSTMMTVRVTDSVSPKGSAAGSVSNSVPRPTQNTGNAPRALRIGTDSSKESEVPEDEREFYVDAALKEVEGRIKRTRAFVKDDDKRRTLKDVGRMKASYRIDNTRRFDNIEAEVTSSRELVVYDPAFSKERFFGGDEHSCTRDPTAEQAYAKLVQVLLHELRHFSDHNVALIRSDPASAGALISDERWRNASWEKDANDFQYKISQDIPNSVEKY